MKSVATPLYVSCLTAKKAVLITEPVCEALVPVVPGTGSKDTLKAQGGSDGARRSQIHTVVASSCNQRVSSLRAIFTTF